MDKNRRHLIKSIGAATASSLAAPYLNLAHAQGSPIPLGVALPLTGNAGAYGPDMGEAAKRTAASGGGPARAHGWPRAGTKEGRACCHQAIGAFFRMLKV